MHPSNSAPGTVPPVISEDDVSLLLLRIARRADELAAEMGRTPGLNRVCWLIAEEELTGNTAGAATLLSSRAFPKTPA